MTNSQKINLQKLSLLNDQYTEVCKVPSGFNWNIQVWSITERWGDAASACAVCYLVTFHCCCCWLFETGSLCAALTSLELTVWPRLASNLWDPPVLCSLFCSVTGGMSHSAWLLFTPVFSRVLVLKGEPRALHTQTAALLLCPQPLKPRPKCKADEGKCFPCLVTAAGSQGPTCGRREHIPHGYWGTCTSCAHTQLMCNKLIHKTFKGCF